MRKIILGFIIILFSLALVVGYANASLRCADCHTMHNSQNGEPVATDDSGAFTTTPHGNLLISTCIGCHRGTTQSDGSASIPIIYSSTAPTLFTSTYAGGNFKWADTADGAYYPYGHNVKGLSPAADNTAMYPPPGYGGTSLSSWSSTEQLTCAGTYGCHGNRGADSTDTDDYEATRGAHHADDATINGTTVGTSFRFLLGVLGTEYNTTPNKWAYGMSNTAQAIHNEYKGLTSPADNVSDTSPGTGGSISGLCAECHGRFHSQPTRAEATATASPWLRHPTDIVLNTGGEASLYNTPDGTILGNYNVVAPVARQSPGTPSETIVVSSDVVMCLSCHVAHASPYKDLLRFVYGDTMTITGGSCLTCHTAK